MYDREQVLDKADAFDCPVETCLVQYHSSISSRVRRFRAISENVVTQKCLLLKQTARLGFCYGENDQENRLMLV